MEEGFQPYRSNYFFTDRHDITADKAFVYTMKGVNLSEGDAHALSLIFDFGGAPAGTHVNIFGISFEKSSFKGFSFASSAFADCPLDTVYIGRNFSYSSLPFFSNTSLRSVLISEKVTDIIPNMFYGCTHLKNINYGDGVTSIGQKAFFGCSSLERFVFGSNVESIGAKAFSGCTSVTQLISRATLPPVCGAQALDDINKWDCTLFVPKGCVEAYRAADQWKEFFFIAEDSSTGIGRLSLKTAGVASYCSLDGRKIKGKPIRKGIYIVNGRKVVVK